jgi:hypothetical protein
MAFEKEQSHKYSLMAALLSGLIRIVFLPAAATNEWMRDATDMDLLRQYAGGNSDAALVPYRRIIINKI